MSGIKAKLLSGMASLAQLKKPVLEYMISMRFFVMLFLGAFVFGGLTAATVTGGLLAFANFINAKDNFNEYQKYRNPKKAFFTTLKHVFKAAFGDWRMWLRFAGYAGCMIAITAVAPAVPMAIGITALVLVLAEPFIMAGIRKLNGQRKNLFTPRREVIPYAEKVRFEKQASPQAEEEPEAGPDVAPAPPEDMSHYSLAP